MVFVTVFLKTLFLCFFSLWREEHVLYDLDLFDRTETINELLARYGVKFGIYKNNTFKEQLFPFDAIPRIIQKQEFDSFCREICAFPLSDSGEPHPLSHYSRLSSYHQ